MSEQRASLAFSGADAKGGSIERDWPDSLGALRETRRDAQ